MKSIDHLARAFSEGRLSSDEFSVLFCAIYERISASPVDWFRDSAQRDTAASVHRAIKEAESPDAGPETRRALRDAVGHLVPDELEREPEP